MFGSGKDKNPPSSPPAAPAKPSRAEIIAQAQANARKARAELGEETINQVASAFLEEHRKKEHAQRVAKLQAAAKELRDQGKK
jgi:hypothetical protein